MVVVVCLHLFLGGAAASGVPEFKFKNYNVGNGLVHNMINAITADKNGFIWLATEGGLSRFDGLGFMNFNDRGNVDHELPGTVYTDLACDGEGGLWLASDRGIFRLNVNTFSYWQPQEKRLQMPSERLALDVSSRSVWAVNTETQVLFRYNYQSGKIDTFQSSYLGRIHDIEWFQGKIYAAVERGGVVEFDPLTRQFKEHLPQLWPFRFSVDQGQLFVLSWQDNNQVLVAGNNEFEALPAVYEPNPPQFRYISSGLVSTSLLPPHLKLISTHVSGLLVYDMDQRKVVQEIVKDSRQKDGLISDKINCVFKDKDGNVWLGTWEGLSMINPTHQQFKSGEWAFMDSKGYNLLSGIKRDRKDPDVLWIGSNGSGVIRYNQRYKRAEIRYNDRYLLNGQDPDYATRWTEFIEIFSNNDVWCGSYGGVSRIRNGQVKHFNLVKNVDYSFALHIYKESETKFWVASAEGLAEFKNLEGEFVLHCPDPQRKVLQGNNISDVTFYKPGSLLVSAYNGLYEYDKKTASFNPLPLQTKEGAVSHILQLVYDSLHHIIYLNSEKGVYFKPAGSQWFQPLVHRNKQLSGPYRHNMLADSKGRLWVYTAQALYRYDPVKNEFESFDQKDGLYNNLNDPPVLFEFEKEIFIGYRGAYTRFDPLETGNDRYSQTPVFCSLNLFGKDSVPDFSKYEKEEFVYSYANNHLVLQYTSVNYYAPEKIRFEYALNRGRWISNGHSRSLNFSELKPGSYLLQLRAVNSSGLISGVRLFRFRVTPPFWQTYWFLALLSFSVVLLIYLYYRNRIRVIRKEENLKTEYNRTIAELESRALRTQMNPHFVFNSLNSIQNFILRNDVEASGRYLSKFARLTRQIFDHSNEQLIPLKLDLAALQTYVELEQMRFVNKFDFVLDVPEEMDTEGIEIPPLLIQPYVENAIWHGIMHKKEGRGKLEVLLSESDDCLHVIIRDNGIGRDASAEYKKSTNKEHRSGAMKLTRDRLEILNKKNKMGISVVVTDLKSEDLKSLGTQVDLYIPL